MRSCIGMRVRKGRVGDGPKGHGQRSVPPPCHVRTTEPKPQGAAQSLSYDARAPECAPQRAPYDPPGGGLHGEPCRVNPGGASRARVPVVPLTREAFMDTPRRSSRMPTVPAPEGARPSAIPTVPVESASAAPAGASTVPERAMSTRVAGVPPAPRLPWIAREIFAARGNDPRAD
jgi:hypothetical protein